MKSQLMKLIIVFLLCASTFFALLKGQLHPMRHYSVKDGLPSSSVYHAMEDREGYMWFATTEGVAKFDGYQFKVFNSQHGLPSNDIFGIQEDDQGRIWAFSFANDLFYIQNDSVHTIDLPDNQGAHSLRSVTRDGLGRYWFRSSVGGLIWEGDTYIRFFEDADQPCDHFLFQDGQANQWYLHENAIARFDGGRFQKVHVLDTIHDWVLVVNQKECIIKESNGNLMRFRPEEGILCRLGTNELFKNSHRAEMGWGRGIAASSSYVFYADAGTVLLDENLAQLELDDRLENKDIRAFTRDRQGNQWFSSITHGIWFVPKHAELVQNMTISDGLLQSNITALASLPSGDLLLGTENGSLMLLSEGKVINTIRAPWQRLVRKIGVLANGEVLIVGNGGIGNIRIDSTRFPNKLSWINPDRSLVNLVGYQVESKDEVEYIPTAAKAYLATSDGSIIYSTSGGIWQEKAMPVGPAQYTSIRLGRTYALALGKRGIMYSGHPNGLAAFRLEHPENVYLFPEMKDLFINELAVTPDSVLWVGTTGNGAYVYFEDQFLELPELQTRSINQIYVDQHREEVWMATDQGAWCINVESYVPFRYQINTISKRDGILSEGINGIAIHDSLIYLATNSGLSIVHRSLLSQQAHSLPLHITGIHIEGKEVALAHQYKLAYDQNDLVISFVGLSYAEKGTQIYAYRMRGVDQDWRKTKELHANYPQLMPGEYRFEVKMLFEGDLEVSETITIDFHIASHWAETGWFRISGALTIILLVVMGGKWRLAVIQKRERLAHQTERKLSALEGRALQAQMNPHFIFNSLNAIQYLMNSGQKDKANIYLANFGKLIRMNLEAAEESTFSLAEELRRLEYYLSLEKLRLNDQISYQIVLEPDLNPEQIQIPCMILHPFVENAIWHGILPSERPGKVEVFIKKSANDGHIVTIRDNGIGIDQGRNSQVNEHQSKGIDLVRRRLKLLQPTRKDYIPVRIRELKDWKGSTAGTQVDLYF